MCVPFCSFGRSTVSAKTPTALCVPPPRSLTRTGYLTPRTPTRSIAIPRASALAWMSTSAFAGGVSAGGDEEARRIDL